MTLNDALCLPELALTVGTEPKTVLGWLSELDGMILCQFPNLGSQNLPYTEQTDPQTPLLVPFPHDALYSRYLLAKNALSLGEYDRYNRHITEYNLLFTAFSNFLNRQTASPPSRFRF